MASSLAAALMGPNAFGMSEADHSGFGSTADKLKQGFIGKVFHGLATLPARAGQAAVDYGDPLKGTYDPAPIMEGAMTAMTGGMPFAQAGALGSAGGKLRGLGDAIPPQAGAEHVGIPNAGRSVTPGETGLDLDTVLYHGSSRYFDRFRPGRVNDSTHSAHETPSVFLTDNPALASEYAASSAKSRLQDTADIYFRNGKEPPSWLYGQGSQHDNAQYKQLIDEAVGLIPAGYPHARLIETMLRNPKYANTADWGEISKDIGKEAVEGIKSKLYAAENVGMDQVYASGAQVYPVHGPKNLLEVDTKIWGGTFQGDMYDQMMKRAKDQGYDGVKFKNVVDSPSGMGEPSTVVAVGDPTKIRSKWAAFDPAKKDSGNLLASLLAAGGIPLGAMASQEQQQ
jgi:hypothetical protein